MNESDQQQQPQQSLMRGGSSVNPKNASDSGYGSNKSTQRSSGSSKSHESSLSSESSNVYPVYPPHPNAVSIVECQSPSQGSPTKRQGKKKKVDRRLSVSLSEKGDSNSRMCVAEACKDSLKSGNLNLAQVITTGQGEVTLGDLHHANATLVHGSQQPTHCGGSLVGQSKTIPVSTINSTSAYETKALQIATFTHALSCMKKFHKPLADGEINEEADDVSKASQGRKLEECFADIQVDISCNEDTFASVVSLEDGIIMYTTASISSTSGFPKEMLVGHSFIDFVHPKDRMAFASHITCGVSVPPPPYEQQHVSAEEANNHVPKSSVSGRVRTEPFYCRLRGLKSVGIGALDKNALYSPFKLTMSIKDVGHSVINEFKFTQEGNAEESFLQNGGKNLSSENKMGNNFSLETTGNGGAEAMDASTLNSNTYLVIVADRIKSAYQYPEEIPVNPTKFMTRHSANCHIGHMDSEAISYLGHLPQDLIGNSVLDYYHPEDMILMKDIYEGVMHEQGKPFRSKPYRFRVYNGTFAMLETDWSCFVNPWSWKLEFVIGQHTVLKGPVNPDVFMQPTAQSEYSEKIPEVIIGESKDHQEEIKRLLAETVTRRLSDSSKQMSSRRKKDLTTLMERLLEEMAKSEHSDQSGSQCSDLSSVLERDSVMLGEISPHHDDQSGSTNQSSETPPSYNQLNYKENIERFFQSQPKTVRSDESAESSKMDTNQSANRLSDSDSKESPNLDYSSGSNLSNSAHRRSSESNENESGDNRNICASPLTEERLSRHNEAMEKFMIQRHRELRSKNSVTHGSHKECRHRHSENVCRGLKRLGNASWDGDTNSAKHPHLDCHPLRNSALCCANYHAINFWPPLSLTVAAAGAAATTSTSRSHGAAPNGSRNQRVCESSCCEHNCNCTEGCNPGENSVTASHAPAPPPPPPLYFLQSQNNHHPQQYASHPVQLFPAGVVYQPLGSCPYSQPHPPSVMMPMPTGILGTFVKPEETGTKPSVNNVVKSEALGVSPFPENERSGTSLCKKSIEAYASLSFVEAKNDEKRSGAGGVTTNVPALHPPSANNNGSDESMNSSSLNTKDSSADGDKEIASRTNSEQGGEMSSGSWKPKPFRNKQPPWLEKVQVTPELMYKYSITTGDLGDVLQKDMEALKIFGKQSAMVNDQLGMLYNELNVDEAEAIALNLEEGISSNSSGDENAKDMEPRSKTKKPITSRQYRKMVILYEENAPFPPEAEIVLSQSTPAVEV